jgi:cell division protein FtsB
MSDRDFLRTEAGSEVMTAIGLVIVAVLVLASFLLFQSVADRRVLLATIANQDQPLQQAQQIKAQLSALTAATAKLAADGDAGAKQIIDSMKRQGIRVEP